MVGARHRPSIWLLGIVALAAVFLLPYGANARPTEVTVSVTYYNIDDTGVTSGSYDDDQYHPVVVMLPAEVFFSNKVTFEDARSGNDHRRVVISIGIDQELHKWKKKTYTGQYDWQGKPKAKKIYDEDYGEAYDHPYIATVWDLYVEINDEWVKEDWNTRTEGQHADVFTVSGPYVPGEPASMTMTNDLIFVSTDSAIDPVL